MSPTRRTRGDGSVYQRSSDGLWVGALQVSLPGTPRRRRPVYGKSKAEVLRKLGKARRALEAGDTTTRSPTLDAWLTTWLDDIAAHNVKPRTLRTYRNYVEAYIRPAIGRTRLDRLGPDHVRALHKSMTTSVQTKRHAHTILKTALNSAQREGRVLRNAADLVELPKPGKPDRRALTAVELDAIFAHIRGDPLEARWQLALWLGARQGECLGLTWPCVDLDAGVLDLAWQLQRIPYRHGCPDPKVCGRRADRCPKRQLDMPPEFEHRRLDGNLCLQRPKSRGSVRVVPIPTPMLGTLRQRWVAYLAERDDYTTDHGLVWCRADGRPIDGRDDWRRWRDLLGDVGIDPPVTLHEARHSAATTLHRNGVDAETVKAILGHSDIVTGERYRHIDVTQMRAALELASGSA